MHDVNKHTDNKSVYNSVIGMFQWAKHRLPLGKDLATVSPTTTAVRYGLLQVVLMCKNRAILIAFVTYLRVVY
jgi:hypothetical protein